MPNAPIAGPRRTPRPKLAVAEDTPTRVYLPPAPPPVRRTPPPLPAAAMVTAPPPPQRAAATTPPLLPGAAELTQTRPSGVHLPSLDYDDPSLRRVPTLESTQPGRRYRMQHVRWFAFGLAVGAVVASLWHGGAAATCRAMRSWSACAIRSLEHKPAALAAVVAAAPRVPESQTDAFAAASQQATPCPAGARSAAAADLCIELLAPFAAAEVQTVSVDDLPRTPPEGEPPPAGRRATPSP